MDKLRIIIHVEKNILAAQAQCIVQHSLIVQVSAYFSPPFRDTVHLSHQLTKRPVFLQTERLQPFELLPCKMARGISGRPIIRIIVYFQPVDFRNQHCAIRAVKRCTRLLNALFIHHGTKSFDLWKLIMKQSFHLNQCLIPVNRILMPSL